MFWSSLSCTRHWIILQLDCLQPCGRHWNHLPSAWNTIRWHGHRCPGRISFWSFASSALRSQSWEFLFMYAKSTLMSHLDESNCTWISKSCLAQLPLSWFLDKAGVDRIYRYISTISSNSSAPLYRTRKPSSRLHTFRLHSHCHNALPHHFGDGSPILPKEGGN